MSMKTPEQIARDMLDEHVRGVRSDIADAALIAWMTRAIEADRAQRAANEPLDCGIDEFGKAFHGTVCECYGRAAVDAVRAMPIEQIREEVKSRRDAKEAE